MPIIPVAKPATHDADGYELDAEGNRIYPPWAAYIPQGGKTKSSARPPWVPDIANYWDDSQAPRGWFKLANGDWGNALDAEHVKEHPELADMIVKLDHETPEPEKKPDAPTIKCKVCDRTFESPHGLKIHMAHHKLTDEHHAKASKEAEEK